MTAQILLDMLRHRYIQLNHISLLVFDECHHTRKKHPYNLIMQEFYFTETASKRPRIFGMTASPIDISKEMKLQSAEKKRNEIQLNLDAKLCSLADKVKSNASDLIYSFSVSVEERSKSSALQKDIEHCLLLFSQSNNQPMNEVVGDGWVEKQKKKVDYFKQIILTVISLLEIGIGACVYFMKKFQCSNLKNEFYIPEDHVTLLHLSFEAILKEWSHRYAVSFIGDPHLFIQLDSCSSKVTSLVQLLMEFNSCKDFRAVVFIEKRCHAVMLSLFLNHLPETRNWIKAAPLTG
jgi:hypothetical protein